MDLKQLIEAERDAVAAYVRRQGRAFGPDIGTLLTAAVDAQKAVDDFVDSLKPEPKRRGWFFKKRLLGIGDIFPNDEKGPFGAFIKVCSKCNRIEEIFVP